VLTDSAMRVLRRDGTADPDVCAAGDIARFPKPRAGTAPPAVQHWNAAVETGRRAGLVLATRLAKPDTYGEVLAEPFEPVPTFWSHQGGIQLLIYGTTEHADDIGVLEGHITGDCTIGYFRHAQLMGVCSIGSPTGVMPYRDLIQHAHAHPDWTDTSSHTTKTGTVASYPR